MITSAMAMVFNPFGWRLLPSGGSIGRTFGIPAGFSGQPMLENPRRLKKNDSWMQRNHPDHLYTALVQNPLLTWLVSLLAQPACLCGNFFIFC
jgi:hypothetical protein